MGFSGAMMPGPMLAASITGSLQRGWKAGPAIVSGHALLEAIAVMLLALGLNELLVKPAVSGTIGLAGGAYLAYMAWGMISDAVRGKLSIRGQQASAAAAAKPKSFVRIAGDGLLLSAMNPYFIIWWATVGLSSMTLSQSAGPLGIPVFFLGHESADLIWYTAVSLGTAGGKRWLTDPIYKAIIIVLGLFMAGFSVYFIWGGVRTLFFRAL